MKALLFRSQTARSRSWTGCPIPSRAGHRFRSAAESGVLAGLLLTVVAAVMVGSHAALLGAVLGAWLVLGAIVSVRNILDAGCFFMLVVVGVILVVDLATNGLASLLY